MACKVNYNQEGKIKSVLDEQGKESILFKKISQHPTVENLEDALEVYKNQYTDKMYQKEENYMLANRVGDKVYGSYAEALQNNPSKIEVGFLDNSGNFLPFKTIKPSFDTKVEKGFINLNIKEGFLSEVKEIYDGESYFQPAGATDVGVAVKDVILRQRAIIDLGWKNYKKTSNGYKFGEHLQTDKGSEESNLIANEIKSILRTPSAEIETKTLLTEDELKLRLLDLLSELGVNGTSISDYVEKYKNKNGIEPSATALADIANKVVAFKNGKITTEDLTEEVSHFIVEGWEQTEIVNLLRNINKTTEYQQFSERYREIYRNNYEGDVLEEAVRKEVLGKVLANALKTNFSTENKKGTESSIISKIKELFDKFMNFIGLNTSPKIEQDLSNFTEQVNELIFNRQLKNYLNTENFAKSKFVLYSATNQSGNTKGLKVEVEKALEILRQTIRKLPLKNKSADLKAKRSLERLQNLTDEQDIMLQKQAALDVISVAESQLNYLNSIIKESKNNASITFGSDETAAYQTLIHNLDPLITSIRANIEANPKLYKKEDKWGEVESQAEELQKNIATLKKNAKNVHEGTIDDLITQIINKHEKLDERYREHVKEWLNAAHKDTTMFHRYFGQIHNSNDPLLVLLSDLAETTFNEGRQEYMGVAKAFLRDMEDGIGFTPERFKELFNDGFLIDELDHAKIEEIVSKIRAEVRKEVTEQKESIEEIIQQAKDGKLSSLTAEQSEEYSKLLKTRLREIQQTYFNETYYKELDDKHRDLGINQVTRNVLAAYSADRAQLMIKAVRTDGTVDWSKLNKSEYEQLKIQKKERKEEKDFFNIDGTLKNGLQQTEDIPQIYQKQGGISEADPIFEFEGFYFSLDPSANNSDEGKIAIDLHKLDKRYTEDQTDDTTKDLTKFLEALNRVETDENKDVAQRFLEVNASIMLSPTFWDNMDNSESFIDKIRKAYVEKGEATEIMDSDIKALRINIIRRRSLLARHKDPNRPFEIEKIQNASVRKQIIELDSEISDAYSRLSSLVGKEEANTEVEKNFEVSVNEAYQNQVKDLELDIDAEIDFISENSTKKAQSRVAVLRYNLESYAKGYVKSLTKVQAEFIKKGGYDITTPDGQKQAIRDFAKSQIGSHYKRLAPKDIDAELAMQEGETVADYTKRLNANPNIDVIPNYSFLEDLSQKYKNPNFKTDYEGGLQVKSGDINRKVPQFTKKGKVVRDEQGNKVYLDETVNFESQRYKDEIVGNTQKIEALEALKRLQKQTLQNYGIDGRHNIYKTPQVTKKGVDRFLDVAKRIGRGGIRQGLEEAFSHRIDDMEYGQSIGSTNVAVVPTYYTRDVENKEELTDELFYSYMLMYQQSVLHKHRKNNISNVLAVKEAVESRAESGRGSATKSTIGMMNNYIDYAFFGRNETVEYKIPIMGKNYDITKFARSFLNFIKFRNLGLSAIVGATSYFTAEIAMQIENLIGETINTDASRLGTKEFGRLAKDSIAETGKIRSKSKLNILGEYFNIFQSEERFNSSNYNYIARNFSKVPMSVHAMGNFPITPRAMMSVLHDFRVVEGSIQNYSDFVSKKKKEGLGKAEIKAEWRKTENQVIYKYLDISEEGVRFTDKLQEDLQEDFRTEEYARGKMQAITSRVKAAALKLDSQITNEQRVAAQRHFALNYLMTHRGWLSVAVSNRTKNMQYNLATGEVEKGSYRTFYDFVTKGIKETVSKRDIKQFRELWNGKDLELKEGISVEDQLLVRRRNMRRVAIESAFLTGFAAVAYAILQYADDEPENYMAQMSSYLMLRVLNEQVSTQTGLGYQMYETLESPFVGLNVAYSVVALPYDLAFGSEEVQSGRYKGNSERVRAIKKVMPFMKTIDDMNQVKQTKDTYYFYNNTNLKFSPISAILVAGLDD